MATIICKRNRFNVVYSYYDEAGKRLQKWEAFQTMPEAKQRKSEIEYKQQLGSFTIPTCNTLNELLKEYVSLYGKTKWCVSTRRLGGYLLNQSDQKINYSIIEML